MRARGRPSADRTRTRRPSRPRAGSRGRTKPNMSAGSPVSLRTARSSGIDLALAHPGAEQVGRQRRVAELADVRAGVREPERDLLVGEQVASPRRRRRWRCRCGSASARSSATATSQMTSSGLQPRSRGELVDPPALRARGSASDSETSHVSQRGLIGDLLEVGGGPGPPGRIAVRGDAARRGRRPCSVTEHRADVQAERARPS